MMLLKAGLFLCFIGHCFNFPQYAGYAYYNDNDYDNSYAYYNDNDYDNSYDDNGKTKKSKTIKLWNFSRS